MVIIHLAIVEVAEQATINGGFGGKELARIAALETDAGFHLCLLHGGFDGLAILPGQSEWLFNDEVFAGFGRGHCLLRVVVGIAANRNGVNALVSQQRVEVVVSGDIAAVPGAEFASIEFARRINRGDLRLFGGVDGRDVRGCDPAVTNDADVVLFHGKSGLNGIVLDCRCQRKRASLEAKLNFYHGWTQINTDAATRTTLICTNCCLFNGNSWNSCQSLCPQSVLQSCKSYFLPNQILISPV